MFLLIHDPRNNNCMCIKFTFHNVSINSFAYLETVIQEAIFTFHNVSINSENAFASGKWYDPIYIPQCFY